jgi:uncharacterized phosphatase
VTQTHIQLIRHGETDWNVDNRYQGSTDIPLNETGRQQAAAVAEAMRGEEWDHMVSSPLSRAMETAQAVADAIGYDRQDIVSDPRAKERSYGEAEGLTLAEREKVWPEGDWPGLEDWEDVALRGMDMIEELAREHAGERVLVVAHGGLINSLLATISKGEVGTGKSIILNTSRTDLFHTGSGWEIGVISDVSHLEDVVTR